MEFTTLSWKGIVTSECITRKTPLPIFPRSGLNSAFYSCRTLNTKDTNLRTTSVNLPVIADRTSVIVAAKKSERNDWNITYYPRGADAEKGIKPWYLIDATNQVLGRVSTLAAGIIRGKCFPKFTPGMDMGGYVIIINSAKVAVTGKKMTDKFYYRTSNRPGSLKKEMFRDLQERIPERSLELSIKGMLPHNRLGRSIFHHLKVYKGPDHPHSAQKPIDVTWRINHRTGFMDPDVPFSLKPIEIDDESGDDALITVIG